MFLPEERQGVSVVPASVTELDRQRQSGQHLAGRQEEPAVFGSVPEPWRILEDNSSQAARVSHRCHCLPEIGERGGQEGGVLESRGQIGERRTSRSGRPRHVPYFVRHASMCFHGEQKAGLRLLHEGLDQRNGRHVVEAAVQLEWGEAKGAGVVDKVKWGAEGGWVDDAFPVRERVSARADTYLCIHGHGSSSGCSATIAGGSSASVPSASE